MVSAFIIFLFTSTKGIEEKVPYDVKLILYAVGIRSH